MASQVTKKNDNILWLAENVDTLAGFQEVYSRVKELELNPKVPWILLNICCEGSEDSEFSSAILSLLRQCKKPIKTQVMTCAHSFGLVFACVGSERVAWPDASFMHHSFHVDLEHTSLEELDITVKVLKNSEKKLLNFMKEQASVSGIKDMLADFKKNAHRDMYFDAETAVRYNIVHSIGFIEPISF